MDFEGGTKLGGWPTCFDCLSWSSDLSIAIVVGDIVEILSPRLQLNSLGSWAAQEHVHSWHRIRLETNCFTEEEMPYIEPEPFRLFSIGAEQSTSQVSALAWSPPGLAKHQRCVLAVLTTNHALSIWASDGDPYEVTSWKRVLVINVNLRDYFSKEPALQSAVRNSEFIEKSRSRIQTFTWVTSIEDALFTYNSQDLANEDESTHAPYIVLSNDANEVVILQIFSPYLMLSNSLSKWDATVVTKFHVSGTTNKPYQTATHTDSIFRPRYPITHIAMSTWTPSGQGSQRKLSSNMAYIAGTELHLRRCELMLDQQRELIVAAKPLVILGFHCGPLQWSQHHDEGKDALFAITNREVCCITAFRGVDLLSLDDLKIKTRQREDCWDRISGLCFAKGNNPDGLSLCYSYHMLNAPEKLQSLTWPLDGRTDRSVPQGMQQVDALKNQFDHDHQLAGHVAVRVWGIVSSHAIDYVAICFSLHPSDMVQYATSSEEESFMIVDKQSSLPLSSCLHPSTEYCLFDISRWINSRLYGRNLSDEEFELLKRQIDIAFPLDDSPGVESRDELEMSTQTSRRQVFLHLRKVVNPQISLKKILHQQLERLRKTSATDPAIETLARSNVQRRLCSAVLQLPSQIYESSKQSRRILDMYQRCRRRIAQQWNPELQLTMTPENEETSESCEICDAVIPFEDFIWAFCSKGHQFIRCGLTLFAIQSPGVTKSCGICNQRYFADEFLRAQENTEKPDEEHAPSAKSYTLTDLIIAAFPLCIYCGGKFIG